jgi:hypothetical protein
MRALLCLSLFGALALSACSGPASRVAPSPAVPPTATVAAAPATVAQTATSATIATAIPASAIRPLRTPEPAPNGAPDEFRTDFARHTIPYAEVLSGGPPKDGIPAIDTPAFIDVEAANLWVRPLESVAYVVINGDARAYPVQVLIWHEIVNDTVGGVPVSVTYCPLCNTAIAFERVFDGRTLDFGTTGRLRYSNMLMYDRQTETWWQQGNGEGVAGLYAGRVLQQRPVALIAWSDFKRAHPDGKVLSRDTGIVRRYGVNPYAGYDKPGQKPFLYEGPDTPKQLPPLARVIGLTMGDDAVAIPYDALEKTRVISATVGGAPVVAFWAAGAASPLDSENLAGGRDIGAAMAFSPVLDGVALTFSASDGGFRDAQTGSTWDHLGRATAGPRAGAQLAPLAAVNHFWFSWAAFYPNTRVVDR